MKFNNIYLNLSFISICAVGVNAIPVIYGNNFVYTGKTSFHVTHPKFSYRPPSHIAFWCHNCQRPTIYPVYHGNLPTYVYQIRETNTVLGDLLSGLALFNLAKSAGLHIYGRYTLPPPETKCSLQIYDKQFFEQFHENIFPCSMISSFMNRSTEMERYEESKIVAIDNTTEVNRTNAVPTSKSDSNLECVIWHNVTSYKERKNIPCALLKEYSKTIKPLGVPVYVWVPTLIGVVIIIGWYCRLCCNKKKQSKEEEPLNRQLTVGYRTNIGHNRVERDAQAQ